MIDKMYKTKTELMQSITEQLYKTLSKHLHGSVTVTEYKEIIAIQINVYALHYNKALFKSDILSTITDAPSVKEYVDSLSNIIIDDYCKYICDRFFN
jgi:hypothetical protein